MITRVEGGSSSHKGKLYQMHYAKLETKKREQKRKREQTKEYWDNNPEWQKKKKLMKLVKIERKAKKREQGNGL